MNSRRRFVKTFIGWAALFGASLSPVFSFARLVLAQTKRLLLPKDTNPEKLFNKDPETLDTRNLSITPLDNFETMGKTAYPVNLNTWRLNISGQVKTPMHLTYDQIIGLPSFEKNVLLICPGVFSYHGQWKGVPMQTLLDLAGADVNATHITVLGNNGSFAKEETFPIEDIFNKKVFLAYGVNGGKLPEKHGYPLRIVAEDYYGDAWVKYVQEIKIVGTSKK